MKRKIFADFFQVAGKWRIGEQNKRRARIVADSRTPCFDRHIFSGSFPLAEFDAFFDAAFDEVAFERADVIEEEFAIQMVCFVQDTASFQI